MMTSTERPAAQPHAESAEFIRGLRHGEVRLPQCDACGRIGHPGERRCTRCMAATWTWITASGRATVFSHTTIGRSSHPAFPAPYVVTVFELEEGPRLLGEYVPSGNEPPVVGLGVVICPSEPVSDDALLRFQAGT